jgi:transcriptional regulator with XRE-family HTH domain
MINLKKARLILGVSQWELEMRSGVHQSRISLFENGLKSPKEVEKVKLATALGLGLNDIEWTISQIGVDLWKTNS